jgi:hypothetical protein
MPALQRFPTDFLPENFEWNHARARPHDRIGAADTSLHFLQRMVLCMGSRDEQDAQQRARETKSSSRPKVWQSSAAT